MSSSLAGDAAGIKDGDYVIDVCGAPGGKGLHAADILGGTGMVEIRDISEAKVSLIEENIGRSGLTNLRAAVCDALSFDPDSEEAADVVIADLPCSGLGIIGRKPDICLLYTSLLQGNLDEEVDDVVYDSRKAAAGSVFVCMRGANVDSHKFIPDVIQKGAKVLVTEEAVTVPEEITVLRVGNGRNALSLLSAARFGYPARKMTTIGVTGTKGKTTTTYMIKAILEAAGEKTGLIGTNGAIIGSDHFPTMNTTPESYILQEYFAKMVEQGCRYMVMEVSSQSYLMHRVDGIFFDYSIFLNISNDHIGPNEHASFEEYLYYKKLLLQNSRVCLVNRDDGHYREIIEGAKAEIKTFSMEHLSLIHI